MTAASISLLVVVSLGLLGVPYAAHGQDRATPRVIAYLSSETPLSRKCISEQPAERAFLEGLRSLGYRDGENVVIECRSGEGKHDRLETLAAELVQLRPAVLVTGGAPASLAAKRATSSIPIVSVYTADPVGLGLVASLARPGANVTGVSALSSDYAAKSLQLLREAAPRASRVGVLGQGTNPTYAIYRRELEAAAPALGVALDFESVNTVQEVAASLSALQRRGADAFLLMHQPLTFVHRDHIVRAVTALGVPAMYGSREAVEAGGLISYAVSVTEVFRRAAFLTDKILHGVKPSELPVEQPTSFQLAINLKTAKSLGLTISPSLRLRAERVIE